MANHTKQHAFGKEHAAGYDARNSHLLPVNENLLYLVSVILADLPADSKILSVGAGTGSEIIALAQFFPQFTFTAVDPSEYMLEVCRERLKERGLLSRCELRHGYVQDLPDQERFQAAICLLVLHHTGGQQRENLVEGIFRRLKFGGTFIASELIYDFSAAAPDDLMEKWQSLLSKTDVPREKILSLPITMREHLSIETVSEFSSILQKAGFPPPTQFFQSLLIHAWYVKKILI